MNQHPSFLWRILQALASLRIALCCMTLSMILVFWGTLAQVDLGTYNAQKVFFNSFLVLRKVGPVELPVFPGGLSLGFLWLINLSAAFAVRFRPTLNKIGLFISHAGLILLLVGQLFTQLYSVETELPLQIGQSHTYYPFTLTLKEFHHDVYPGTDIPKNFSSLIHLVDPIKKEERDVLIYMNHPLRYDGKTFYQASFGNNNTLSVFQVVENPFAASPYISCSLIFLGLGIHFLMSLTGYLRKRS